MTGHLIASFQTTVHTIVGACFILGKYGLVRSFMNAECIRIH
jgi:hypothetical protein